MNAPDFDRPESLPRAALYARYLLTSLVECHAFIGAALDCEPAELVDFIANNAEDLEDRLASLLRLAGCTE